MTNSQYLQAALRHILLNPGCYRQGFEDWLLDNLEIQRRFDVEALHIASTGRAHYSAYTIVEYLRHHTALYGRGKDFKINNNLTASMARLFAVMHPQHKDLFEYRT